MAIIEKLKSRYRVLVLILVLLTVACSVGDDTPPATVEDLTTDIVTRILNWTAPGDNGNSGRATIYFIRYLDNEQVAEILGVPNLDGVPFADIQAAVQDNFDDATQVPDFEQPLPAGELESFLTPRLDITGQTTFFYGMFTNDEVGNSSNVSNVVELTTGLENVRYVSSDSGSCLGESIASANFNGDLDDQDMSINDIAIGDPCLGLVYIFFGQNDLTNNGETTIDVSAADVTVVGNAAEGFGSSLGSTGDFRGDLRADELIIGAPDFNGGTGKVYIMLGSRDLPDVVDLTDDSVEHIEIVGENPGDNFGFTVADGTRVLNGQGVMVAAAPSFNSDTGKIYIFRGPDLDTESVNQAVQVANATFTGQDSGGLFGFSLDILGRIDDNNYDELGVGAPGIGTAYVIFGRDNLQSANLASDTTDVLVIEGDADDDFGFSISGNGDIDQDGEETPDVIVGAPGTNSDTGSVYLYSGDEILSAFNQGIQPDVETEFTGSNAGDLFGASISVMPNLTPETVSRRRQTAIVLELEVSNADFGVGAPGTTNGTVYLFLGRDDFPSTVSAADADITHNGEGGDMNLGSLVEGIGDINGDQFEDFGVGGVDFMDVVY
jgi:hypothetical protein